MVSLNWKLASAPFVSVIVTTITSLILLYQTLFALWLCKMHWYVGSTKLIYNVILSIHGGSSICAMQSVHAQAFAMSNLLLFGSEFVMN